MLLRITPPDTVSDYLRLKINPDYNTGQKINTSRLFPLILLIFSRESPVQIKPGVSVVLMKVSAEGRKLIQNLLVLELSCRRHQDQRSVRVRGVPEGAVTLCRHVWCWMASWCRR